MARKSRKQNNLQQQEVKQEKIYKIGAYIRLSIEDNGKNSDSIESQKAIILDYVDKNPQMELFDIYCDNGETGVNFNRPSFMRLMNDVKARKVDCIIIKDLSRFGRNYIETGNYLEKVFPFLGVRFISINDNFDTISADRNQDGFIIPLKNLMHDIYSKDISKKVSSALEIKQKNGDFIGCWSSYGYKKDPNNKNHLIIDEEVAHIVVDIYNWRTDGLSVQNIVRKLESLRIPSPSKYRYEKGLVTHEKFAKTRWSPYTLKSILTSEIYLGHMIQGKKKQCLFQGQKQKFMPKENWIIVKNTHEPIINQELFDRVQVITDKSHLDYMENHNKISPISKTENLLKGIIYCGECDGLLSRHKHFRINKHKEPKHYVWYTYTCTNSNIYKDICTFTSIKERDVLEAVTQTLQTHFKLLFNINEKISKLQKTPKFRNIKHNQALETDRIHQKLSKISNYKKALMESYLTKVISNREYTLLSKSYDDETEKLNIELSQVEKTDVDLSPCKCITEFEPFAKNEIITRDIILALVEKVTITKSKEVFITLKYIDEFKNLITKIAEYEVVMNG